MGASSQDLSIQVDPLTENAYTFVDGDPVNLFDPTGHHAAYDQNFAGEAQPQMADFSQAVRISPVAARIYADGVAD